MKNRKEYKASLTVEAALAFPVFFFAVMALCCLFLYMEAETAVGEAMLETARSVSVYGDILKEPPVELILEEKLKREGVSMFDLNCAADGDDPGDRVKLRQSGEDDAYSILKK